jgi:hypothetical protein
MDATALERLIGTLRTTAAWAGSGGDTVALAELADLVALTALVEQLNEQGPDAPRDRPDRDLAPAPGTGASRRPASQPDPRHRDPRYNTAQHSPLAAAW